MMKEPTPESMVLEKLRRLSEGVRNGLSTPNVFGTRSPTTAFRMAKRRIRAAIAENAKELYLFGYGLESLPEEIRELKELWHLSLAWNRLAQLPDSLSNLQELAVLNLSNNQLKTVPESLGTLENLKMLLLRSNRGGLPRNLDRLTHLHFLDLRENRLGTLPESIGNLQQLRRIDLSENRLTELPKAIGHLKDLTYLNLSRNSLEVLPETLGQLVQLRWLDLRHNHVRALPESLGQLANLELLDLRHNGLGILPESMGQLRKLAGLDLGYNELTKLPDSCEHLAQLTQLNLQRNRLEVWPGSLSEIAALTALNLSNNKLTALPESIGRLTGLTALGLQHNQLTELRESIGQLHQLTLLLLAGNKLTALPESVGQLAQLATLDVSRNELTALPESIGQLSHLSVLDLRGNRLTALPQCLQRLPALFELRVDGNELGLPAELVKSNHAGDILEYYFRSLSVLKPTQSHASGVVGAVSKGDEPLEIDGQEDVQDDKLFTKDSFSILDHSHVTDKLAVHASGPDNGRELGSADEASISRWDRSNPVSILNHIDPNDDFVLNEVYRALRQTGQTMQQIRTREAALKFCKILYKGMQRHHFVYDFEPVSDARGAQPIRMPLQIQTYGRATCIDITCLLAAIFEAAHQKPVIGLLEGLEFQHSIVGYRAPTEPAWVNPTIGTLRRAVEDGSAVFFESTGVLEADSPVGAEEPWERSNKLLSFNEAHEAASRMIAKRDVRLKFLLDVYTQRTQGIP